MAITPPQLQGTAGNARGPLGTRDVLVDKARVSCSTCLCPLEVVKTMQLRSFTFIHNMSA
jgi:hypothetical protein